MIHGLYLPEHAIQHFIFTALTFNFLLAYLKTFFLKTLQHKQTEIKTQILIQLQCHLCCTYQVKICLITINLLLPIYVP